MFQAALKYKNQVIKTKSNDNNEEEEEEEEK